MSCSYCDGKDVEARIIYKDNLVMAFPTNIPITPGHTLMIPIQHVATVAELSTEELTAIKDLLVRIQASLRKCLQAEGFNIAWNEGAAGGQTIDHLHIHIVPRHKGDAGIYQYEPRQFLYRPGAREESTEAELKEVAEMIKNNLE